MKQPNILFIFSDQQRWDTVGAYGQKLDVTPNLDRLARTGVIFENAFTCQPVCGPARACLQTGKYATEVGCFRNGIALPLDETTIAHRLSGVGYDVGYVGKWHLASTRKLGDKDIDYREKAIPPERRGGYKDYWVASDILEFTSHSYDGHMFNADMERVDFPEGRYRVDCVTDYALDFLRGWSRDNPFFLFISYIEPHHQNDHKRYEGPHGSKERFKDFEVPGDLADTAGNWRENYADYLGCCFSIDQNVGRLVDQLEDIGVLNDTLIIYTSDHGSHFKTRNSEYKRSCHDGCIRIPMILNGPGFNSGKRVNNLVSLIDLPKTICSAAGAAVPDEMQGRDLRSRSIGSDTDWNCEVFLQISESQVGRAVRTRKWKYSIRAPGKSGTDDMDSDEYREDFLYDLEKDPHEKNNLAADPGCEEIRSVLRERIIVRMKAAGETPPVIKNADGEVLRIKNGR